MKRLLLFLVPALAAGLAQESADRSVVQQPLPEVLWRAPRPATVQDWICGFAGCDHAPSPPFSFVKADVAGTTPKMTVKDAKGRTFSVKFGSKVIPQCFSPRFVAALGYISEPSYYVAAGKVEGMKEFHRIRSFVQPDGSFTRACFELRDPRYLEFLPGRAWSLADNPFSGSREFAGLRVLLALLSNWDTKDSRDGQEEANTGVFRSPGSGRQELLYSFFDWGSTLGRWGGFLNRTRSDCSGFSLQTPDFLTGVRAGVVEWGYSGKRTRDVTTGITVDDLRWLSPYLERITGDEIRAGLKASGATGRQTACWTDALLNRIEQVEAVARLGRYGR